MTREDKRAYNYARDRLANDDYPVYSDEYELKLAYKAGIEDAKNHPHWISVEEELPKEHEWIIGFSLKREYIDVYNFDSNGLIEAHDITHWMHLSPPPILSNSENTGKDHLIGANNMIDLFAGVSKKVEKGGDNE